MRRLYLFTALALVLYPTAHAQSGDDCDIVVANQTGDTGDHTTISAAVAAAGSGDTICVKRGVYYEDVRPSQSGLTIQAYPGDDHKWQVVVSGADALPAVTGTGGWEYDKEEDDYKWTWSPDMSWETDNTSGIEWFSFSFDSVHGPEHVQRRELLIAKVPGHDSQGFEAPGTADEDRYDGHVMQAVASRADLDTGCSNVDAGVCGTYFVDTVGGNPTAPPIAIYARFYNGGLSMSATPEDAEPMIAVRRRTFMPSGGACGLSSNPRDA